MSILKVEADLYELNVDEKLRPSVERQLSGRTNRDMKVDSLAIPEKKFLLKISILLLRWYRKNLSQKLGNRCVFDPSCSRYCELVIRETGLLKGFYLTIKRLFRCRPGNGGLYLPPTRGGKNAV